MSIRIFDSGAGSAAALSSPWVQMNLEGSTLNRDGAGNFKASGVNTTSDTVAYRNDSIGNDQWARITINAALDPTLQYCGVVLRASGTSGATAKAYTIFTDGGSGASHTGIGMYWNSNATTVLKTVTTTFTQGDELMGRVVGTVIYMYKNGVLIDSYDTSGDTNQITSGGPGITMSNYDTNTMLAKNFEAGDTSIVYLRSAKASQSTPNGSLAITANLASGETGLLLFGQNGGTLGSISSVSGGGTWAKKGGDAGFNATLGKGETYGLLSATSAATVTVSYSGTPDSVAGLILIYIGVVSFGANTQTSNTSSTSPTVSLTTNSANSIAAAGFFWDDGTVTPPAASVGIKRDNIAVVSTSDNNVVGYDNFSASAGAVADTSTAFGASGSWGATAIELSVSTGITAALSGTALSSITEADIVAGGKTIIITLTGDTWIPI